MIDQMVEIVEVAQFVDLRGCTECSLHVVRAVQLLGLQGNTKPLYFGAGKGRG